MEAASYNVPRGAALISMQHLLHYGFSFVFYVAVARILTQEQIGQVSLLMFLLTTFGALTQLSLPVAATKFISENLGRGDVKQAGAVARTTLKLLLMISVPALLVSYLISPYLSTSFFQSPELTVPVILTFTASFILDLTTLYGAQLLGLGRYFRMVLQNMIYIPLSRMLGLLLAYVGLGVMGVVLGWFFASLVTLTVTLPLVKGQIPDGSSFPAKILLGYSLPLLGFNVVGLVQTWADVTLLYALTASLSATGIYYIVVSSAAVLSVFWSPLAGAVFPALSSTHGKGDAMALERMLTTSIRVINVSVIPLSFSMAAVSPAVLHAVYGEAYIVGAAAFAIVASTLVIQAYAAIISTTLQAIGKTKTLLWVAVASTALEIMFLTLLAKPLGGVGAAVARVILFTASATLGYMYLRGDVRLMFGENFIKSLALGLCVAAPLVMVDFYLVQYLPNMPLARIAVLAAVFTSLYTAAARKLGILSPADFSLLRQALPKPLHPSVNLAEKLFTRSRKGQG